MQTYKQPWLSSLLCLVLVPSAFGENSPSAARLFPKETVLFARISDVPKLRDHFRLTSFSELITDPAFRPHKDAIAQWIRDSSAELERQLEMPLGDLLEIPTGGVSFGLVHQQGQPAAYAVVVDLPDDPTSARSLIEFIEQRLLKEANDFATERIRDQYSFSIFKMPNERQVVFCQRKNAMLIATNVSAARLFLDLWDSIEGASCLADSESYRSAIRHARHDGLQPDVIAYLDPIALAKAVTHDNIAAQIGISAMVPQLGLDGFKAMAGGITFGTAEHNLVAHVHALLNEERKGVLEGIALKPFEAEPELVSWASEDVASYATYGWDMDQTYRTFGKIFDKFRGEGSRDAMVERRVSGRFGVDLQTDFLDQLEGEFVRVTWFEPPPRIDSRASVLGIKLKDGEEFSKTFQLVVDKQSENLRVEKFGDVNCYTPIIASDRPESEDVDVAPEEAERRARRRRARRQRRNNSSYALLGDYLLIADRPTMIENIVQTDKSGPSLSRTGDIERVLDQIGRSLDGKEPCWVSVGRSTEFFRNLHGILTSENVRENLPDWMRRAGLTDTLVSSIEEHSLPPFARIEKYFGPSGMVVSDDDSGLHLTLFYLRPEQAR